MKPIILSIDCGTQSLRAILFSSSGEVLGISQITYEPYVTPKPGRAEQDPDIYWQSLCRACRELKERFPSQFREISGVGVTTLRDSLVNVDKKGNPLRPVITFMDQRKARRVYAPKGIMKLGYRIVGMEEAIYKVQSDGKCNWIMQYEPEIWKKTFKYLQISGFLNFRLTGKFIDSIASQIGHIPINYKKRRWAKKRELTARLFPIHKDKLPDTLEPGATLGAITATASTLTGIRQGVPVLACGSDKGCETIGMGVLNEQMANLSFGTMATVQTTTKKFYNPVRFLPPYPAPIPDYYNPEIEIYRGYWMITWFKNEFAYKEVREAEKTGVVPEEILNRLLFESPPGSLGLMVQPFWGPGIKQPSAKGAIIGFGDVHKKAHIYRAVVEGLSYALLDGLRKIERASGHKVEKVAVSGGASQSNAICQITSDVFDLPVVKGQTHEASGLGAAIVCSVGLGIYPSFAVAVDEMVSYVKVFEPNPDNVSIYKKLYHKIYKKMYDALSPLYRDIRDITGYPE